MSSNETKIQHDKRARQFFIVVGEQKAYLSYMDLGKKTLDYYRTFVPQGLRGRGFAAKLTEYALKYAEQTGYSVIPSCSYVERFMQRYNRDDAKTA
ncbi:hypothetical protein SAMN05216210_1565 [Halopseudomonas salegens]|uniref:N-acetyltransferase domain-containing protein n=2 Tax=Halopseudomonas salegens TaxID=1434072 RepID=A0A1H2FHD7_9GAMM|nr:GNAT family N-acetyltransferase [Halopseudomonas salegens]SDU06790.1 hypothetical protein SAMN05216210_1565 [Halopseudomonas salegens]